MNTPDKPKPSPERQPRGMDSQLFPRLQKTTFAITTALSIAGCGSSSARSPEPKVSTVPVEKKKEEHLPVRPPGSKTLEEIETQERLNRSMEKTMFYLRSLLKRSSISDSTRLLILASKGELEHLASELHMTILHAEKLSDDLMIDDTATLNERILAHRELHQTGFYFKIWLKITELEEHEKAKELKRDLEHLDYNWMKDLSSDPKYQLMQERERARGK